MPQSWRLAGWAVFGLLMLFFALVGPARADVNPWDMDVAQSGHGLSPPSARAARGHIARLHGHGHRLYWLGRDTPDAPTGGMLRGVVPPLALKAREIVSACGSRISSGQRHTRVSGSGRLSLHASGRAVDLVGNPGCIYAHLRSWPGGVSTDYARVRHVHVSLGGGEDGLRFAHRHGSRRTRIAAR